MQVPAPLRSALLALTGIAVAGVTTLLIILQLRLQPALADVLPAEQVLLYWNQATPEQISPWISRFPVLASLPRTTQPFQAAVVQQGDSQQWIMVPGEDDPLVSQARPLLDTLRSLQSGDISIVTDKSRSLAADAGFRALTHDFPGAFVRMASLGAVDNRLLGAFGLHDTCCGWLTLQPSGFTYSWVAGDAPRPSQSAGMPLHPPATIALRLRDATGLINSLTPDAISRAVLSKRVVQLVGKNVSLDYDILPVLRSPSLLRLQEAHGSWERFLAQGEADAEAVKRLTDRLHGGTVSETRIEEIVHEGVVEGRTVTAEGAKDTATEQRDGWTLRLTGDARGMFTAVRGRRYIITNDRAWLESSLTEGAPEGYDGLSAYGVLPAASGALLPDDPRTPVQPLLRGTGPTEWSLAYNGGVWILTVTDRP